MIFKVTHVETSSQDIAPQNYFRERHSFQTIPQLSGGNKTHLHAILLKILGGNKSFLPIVVHKRLFIMAKLRKDDFVPTEIVKMFKTDVRYDCRC